MESKNPPLHALTLIEYGIPKYRGIHIVHNKQIKDIGFDGVSCNNEKSVAVGVWLDVRILRAFKKYM